MKINIIKPFLPTLDEISSEFSYCLDSGIVSNGGKYVNLLQDKLQIYFNSTNKPLLLCNGEMALYNLIQAWKIKLGYSINESFKVIVPSFTFVGTVNAIVANNLIPVFADVDESMTINIDKCIVDASDIKMMVPVSAYGNLPNLDKAKEFCRENNIVLIMDNAPSFGAQHDGKFTCNHGIDAIYSLHASKVLNSMEGGICISNDEEICEIVSSLRDFGQFEKTRGNVRYPGLNSKMPEISAIVGLKNLDKIDFILNKRMKVVEKMSGLFSTMLEKGYFKIMRVDNKNLCPYLYYPLILNEEASSFCNHMNQNDISVRRYYTAVHTLDFYKNRYPELDLSYTESIKDNVVSLPVHTMMTDEEIQYVFETVKKYFER